MFIDDLARTSESSIGAQYGIRLGVAEYFAPTELDHFVTAPTINIRLLRSCLQFVIFKVSLCRLVAALPRGRPRRKSPRPLRYVSSCYQAESVLSSLETQQGP